MAKKKPPQAERPKTDPPARGKPVAAKVETEEEVFDNDTEDTEDEESAEDFDESDDLDDEDFDDEDDEEDEEDEEDD